LATIEFDDVQKIYEDGTQAVFDLSLKIEDIRGIARTYR